MSANTGFFFPLQQEHASYQAEAMGRYLGERERETPWTPLRSSSLATLELHLLQEEVQMVRYDQAGQEAVIHQGGRTGEVQTEDIPVPDDELSSVLRGLGGITIAASEEVARFNSPTLTRMKERAEEDSSKGVQPSVLEYELQHVEGEGWVKVSV